MDKNKFIPLSVPNITGNEIEYVTKALRDEWVSTAGECIQKFEENMSVYVGGAHACACQSGTAGLHLCLRHFGIGQDDIILLPTLTFVATINAVMYEKAVPVFFDCDDYLCINIAQVKNYLTECCEVSEKGTIEKKSGKYVKAIMPVHIFGNICEMEQLMKLAEEYKLVVIEDATEALGSKYIAGKFKGAMAGTLGHAGVYSFNGNKIITTGGGGMIVSNDVEAIEHMRYLSQQAKDDGFYFVHEEIGYNYRMTNIQAAMGIGQLERLDEFIQHKMDNFKLYCTLLGDSRLGHLIPFREDIAPNGWFYSFCLNKEWAPEKDKIMEYLKEQNIQVRPIWKLNHLQTPFLNYDTMSTECAEDYYTRVINLPCSSNLSKDDVKRVCQALLEYEKAIQ